MWPVFLQRQQSGEAVSLYKGGAGQAGHAAADNSNVAVQLANRESDQFV